MQTFSDGYPIPNEKYASLFLEEWEAEAEDLGIPVDGLFTAWALGFLTEQKSKRRLGEPFS